MGESSRVSRHYGDVKNQKYQHVECRLGDRASKRERRNLMSYVRAGIADVPIHFSQHAYVLVAVEKGVLVFAVHACAADPTMRGFVGLEAGIGENDDQSLRIFVGRRDWHILLGYKLGQLRRRERLSS